MEERSKKLAYFKFGRGIIKATQNGNVIRINFNNVLSYRKYNKCESKTYIEYVRSTQQVQYTVVDESVEYFDNLFGL